MKRNYFLILLILPALFYGQIKTLANGTVPDLSPYFGDTSENIAGVGEYQMFLDTEGSVLDKPIIITDSFDPRDERSIAGMYTLLDYSDSDGVQNLADYLRSEGYDIILLNFPVYTRSDMTEIDGGSDFIERNAMILADLIQVINSNKVGEEELVIIGPGIGGLISKYALNYMEANMLDHDTRLWLSFDAPHLGANVPIGLQHLVNDLFEIDIPGVGGDFFPQLEPIINDNLNSAAVRQLLTDHFESSITTPEPHPWRTSFIGDAFATSFPQNSRNISMINGSSNGNSYVALGMGGTNLVSPGFRIILPTQADLIPGMASLSFECRFTSESNSSGAVVSSYELETSIGDFEVIRRSSTGNFDGIDPAPGGTVNLLEFLGEGLPIDNNFLRLDKFNFVPSVSAMALEITNDEPDWFHVFNPPNNRGTNNNTPFDAWYAPTTNEPHLQLNESNVAFALAEILTPSLNVLDSNPFNFRIEKNVIDNELVLLSDKPITTNINIIDLTGKTIFQTNTALNNRTSIGVDLTSGFYILKIVAENSATYTVKFIVY